MWEQEYTQIKNGIAFQQLDKAIPIPNVTLAVEQGETLAPVKMKVEYQQHKNYVVVPNITSANIEVSTLDGGGKAVTQDDFPKLFYFGDSIGGM